MVRDRTRVVLLALALGSVMASCKGDGADSICRTEAAPETGLRITAGTDAYFYAHDANGRQVGYERLNRVLALEPGDYHAVLNDTRRPVSVRSGAVTTCSAGDVKVAGTTDAYYYALDTAGTQLAYQRVGQLLSLLPGSYQATVNASRTRLEILPGDTTEIASGAVVVEGPTEEYYYVLDGQGAQLAYDRLGRPLDLFPGAYVVKVNNSTASVTAGAGATSVIRSGTVVVHGTTDQYYYVLDTAGTQLGYQRLGRPMAYVPGRYRVRLIDVDTAVSVRAGESTQVATGTLVVSGSGSEYYYVDDTTGRQLHYGRLGSPTAILGGQYTVRVADRRSGVTIAPGRTTTAQRP